MKDWQDHYHTLHVHPDADVAIIKASYRTLMQKLKYHPDLGGDKDDAARINEAYGVLSNLTLRTAYDQQLAVQRQLKKDPEFKPWPNHQERKSRTSPNSNSKPNPRANTKSNAKQKPRPQTNTHGQKQAHAEAQPKPKPESKPSPKSKSHQNTANEKGPSNHTNNGNADNNNTQNNNTQNNKSDTHNNNAHNNNAHNNNADNNKAQSGAKESSGQYSFSKSSSPKRPKQTAHRTRSKKPVIPQKHYAELGQHTYASITAKLPDTSIRSSTCLFCKEINHFHPHGDNQEAIVCFNCKSPLQFINFNPLWVTQRRSDRLKQKSLIQFTANHNQAKSYQGIVVDLSPTGMRIKSLQALKMGNILKLDNEELSAVASVIRCEQITLNKFSRNKYFYSGVKFLALKVNQNRGTFVSHKA